MRTFFAALLGCVFLLAQPGGAQEVVEPFGAPPRPADTAGLRASAQRRLEARAIQAAGLLRSGDADVSVRAVGGARLVFVRGWVGAGTGFWQIAHFVFAVRPDGRLHRVWRAVAAEHLARMQSLPKPFRSYDLRACLYLVGSDRIAYTAVRAPPRRGDPDPPFPRRGEYVLQGAGDALRWLRPAAPQLTTRCAAEPALWHNEWSAGG